MLQSGHGFTWVFPTQTTSCAPKCSEMWGWRRKDGSNLLIVSINRPRCRSLPCYNAHANINNWLFPSTAMTNKPNALLNSPFWKCVIQSNHQATIIHEALNWCFVIDENLADDLLLSTVHCKMLPELYFTITQTHRRDKTEQDSSKVPYIFCQANSFACTS